MVCPINFHIEKVFGPSVCLLKSTLYASRLSILAWKWIIHICLLLAFTDSSSLPAHKSSMLLAGSLYLCLGLHSRGLQRKDVWTGNLSTEIEIIGFSAFICLPGNESSLFACCWHLRIPLAYLHIKLFCYSLVAYSFALVCTLESREERCLDQQFICRNWNHQSSGFLCSPRNQQSLLACCWQLRIPEAYQHINLLCCLLVAYSFAMACTFRVYEERTFGLAIYLLRRHHRRFGFKCSPEKSSSLVAFLLAFTDSISCLHIKLLCCSLVAYYFAFVCAFGIYKEMIFGLAIYLLKSTP